MFGSQALETAIGLALMFFVLATAASAVTETISRAFKKRSKDLERGIKEMLTVRARDPDARETKKSADKNRLAEANDFFKKFKETSIWQAAEAASGRTLLMRRKVGNSYLSAKSFADAVHEVLTAPATQEEIAELKRYLDKVPSLKTRLDVLVRDARRGMLDVKAGLEKWFDETMGRAEGAYKRWASVVLFGVGLFLAVVGNASTTDVARDLWQDSGTRAAVTEAASNLGDSPDDIGTVSEEMSKLSEFHLPVGWDVAGEDPDEADDPVQFLRDSPADVVFVTLLGWLLTAVLLMLGAPFWFDLLSRLVSLRSSGAKPPPAANDGASATRLVATSSTGGGLDADAAHGLSNAAKAEYRRELEPLVKLLEASPAPGTSAPVADPRAETLGK
jgi:hypothetical protein